MRRTPRWIVAGWGVVCALVGFALIPQARANHPHTGWDQLHISTIHGNNGSGGPGSLDEQYCVVSYTSSVNSWSIRDYIWETLVALDFAIIWDGSADWRVDLWRTSKLCNQYETSVRNDIEIEYRVDDDWTYPCDPGFSCVTHVSPQTDSSGAHQHYRWMNSHFVASHVWGYDIRARKFINHETGHVLGLGDPWWYGHCPYSVMHNDLYDWKGCYDPVWHPTSGDFSSVRSIADRTN